MSQLDIYRDRCTADAVHFKKNESFRTSLDRVFNQRRVQLAASSSAAATNGHHGSATASANNNGHHHRSLPVAQVNPQLLGTRSWTNPTLARFAEQQKKHRK